MNSVKAVYSLKYRMVIALGVSLLIALGVYFLFSTLSGYLINSYYLSDEAIAKRSETYMSRFSAYVKENKLYSADHDALQKWIRQNPNAYLTIYDESGAIWESGWWDETITFSSAVSYGTAVYPSDSEDIASSFSAVPSGRSTATAYYDELYKYLYKTEFMDGIFWIDVVDFSEINVLNVVQTMVTVFSILLVFPIVLLYARIISNRIIRLTGEVNVISAGDLAGNITTGGKDEIAELADGVDIMKHSIIEQLEKEQIAWRANSDLITSMSHDIRTPLTVLLGYTGLIKNKQYSSAEEFDSYVEVIEKKSIQLKELSDKLFKYFLVFGNASAPSLEVVSAKSILSALMGEHTVLLSDAGFVFITDLPDDDCLLSLDISHTKRLFDNIFSNIEKYADQSAACKIHSAYVGGNLKITISNAIGHSTGQVESTRIGLKTCERIAELMNGKFETVVRDEQFTAVVTFPVSPHLPT